MADQMPQEQTFTARLRRAREQRFPRREDFISAVRLEAARLNIAAGNQRRGNSPVVSSETIRLIEEGRTQDPRARLLALMARVLGVTVEYLLFGSTPPQHPSANHLTEVAAQLRALASSIEPVDQKNLELG